MKRIFPVVLTVALLGVPALAEKKPKPPKAPKVDPKARNQAPANTGPVVTVVGVSVIAPALGREGDEVRPFQEQHGTQLFLAVTIAPPFGIIDIQGDPESLEFSGGAGLLDQPEISASDLAKDGKGGLVAVRSPGLPVAGTAQLSAKGTLKLLVSSGAKIEKVASVRLEKGSTLALRGTTLTLTEAETTDERISVSLEGPTSAVKAIKSLRFKAGSGPAVEGEPQGGGWGGDTSVAFYAFATKDRVGSLEVDLWQDPREVSLPFRVDAGVGLPAPPVGMAKAARPALDPLPAGTASGQLVVDGKAITLGHAVAASGPDTFDATKEAFTVLLTEKPIPADKVEGAASLEKLDDLLSEGLVMTVRQDERNMQSYRLVILHPSAGKGMQQSSSLFAKERWSPLGPDRVVGAVKSSSDDKPSEMLNHQVHYRVRFDAPVRKKFAVEAPLVLAAGATKLALGGGAPGKAWLTSQCGALPVDPSDPKAVEAFLIKEGKMPTEQDLAQMSKEMGKPVTKDEAMKLFSAMLEMGAAFRPKNCKVLGGSTDGKLAILQVEAIVLDGKSRADAYMVKDGAEWTFKKNGTWSAVQ
jgi:hypothetical protein